MSINNMSGSRNFAAHKLALMWAKENLSEEEYIEIKTSYDCGIKKGFIFIICTCIPIMIMCLFFAFYRPISTYLEKNAMPNNATCYVVARIDYDNNFYWTSDSKIYEYPLVEYGISSEEYEYGDKVKVYIDDDQNIIKVSETNTGNIIENIELIGGVLGSLLIPLLIILMFRSHAKKTFAKKWFDFYENF